MSGNSTPNWNALVEQGRAKAIGVPWSDDELRALYELKIPLEYVRGGCTTREVYEQVLKEGQGESGEMKEKDLRYMKKDELLKKARSLGLEAPDIATRADLILSIEERMKKEVLTK